MKFLKSTIITFFSNIFIFSISILATVITSRMLGPAGKGVLSVANNLISVSLIVLGFGIASSNVFYVGKERKDVDSIIGVNLIIACFTVAVVTILYFINLKANITFLFKGLSNSTILIVLLIVPFMNLKTSLINILLGLQEIVSYNKINIFDNVLSLILMIVFIFTFGSAYSVLISMLISVLTILLILVYILFYKRNCKINFKKILMKDMLKYGIKAQTGNAVQFLNYRLDIFIINYLLNLKQVGIYSNAVALGETMWKVSGSVSTMMLPMTTNSKNKIEMKHFVNKVTRMTLTLIIICSVLLVAVSKPIILLLLGKEYIGSVNALLLLIPGISIFSVCNILSSYIAGIGLVEKNIIASSVSCIITIILDFTLIPLLGINGASIATSISYITATMITVFFYIKITGSTIKEMFIMTKDDFAEVKNRCAKIIKR